MSWEAQIIYFILYKWGYNRRNWHFNDSIWVALDDMSMMVYIYFCYPKVVIMEEMGSLYNYLFQEPALN